MKTYLSITLLVLTLISNPSYARHYHTQYCEHNTHYERVQVIKVKPIYKVVDVYSPTEEFWQERVERPIHHRQHNLGGIISGGIIGGVVGHQVGRGHGKYAATIAGTLLGAVIGNNVANHHRPHH